MTPVKAQSRSRGINSEQAAAYHEAAHAVVSYLLGARFEYIELRHEVVEWPNGQKGVRQGQFKPTGETVYRDGALREACISMAGIVAHKKMFPHHSYLVLAIFIGGVTEATDIPRGKKYPAKRDICEYQSGFVHRAQAVVRAQDAATKKKDGLDGVMGIDSGTSGAPGVVLSAVMSLQRLAFWVSAPILGGLMGVIGFKLIDGPYFFW